MNTILLMQKMLQDAMAIEHGRSMPSPDCANNAGELCDFIRNTAFHLNQEVVELAEEIGGKAILKPWKKDYSFCYERPVEITDKVKSEAIDVLCFAINICLAAGITAENVFEEYSKVYSKNMDRLNNGY